MKEKNKVKETKIFVIVHKFELFQIMKNETISEIITRFTNIINSLVALEKQYTQVEMVREVLCAHTAMGEKATAIKEANNLSTLTLENLVGNLMACEVQLQEKNKDE